MQPSKTRVPGSGRGFAHALLRLALGLAAAGCAEDSEPKVAEMEDTPRVWVGEVADSDVRVGLTLQDGRINLFFCGGAESFDTNTRWFSEDVVQADGFSFTAGGWHVEASVDGESVMGTVEPDDGDTREWSALEIAPRTSAGLYEGTAPCGKLGLIVSQPSEDDEPSGQGACMRVEGDSLVLEQVNPVFERSADFEIPVTVESQPDEEFTVRPVVAAEQ
jgi:hypothetical protein